MVHTAPAFELDVPQAAPLWRDAVVGASVAAMAAAIGLGTHVEAGVAPWLSIVAGSITAVALWGAHRQFSRTPDNDQRTISRRPAPFAVPATRVAADTAAPKVPDHSDLASFTPRPVKPAAGSTKSGAASAPHLAQRDAAPPQVTTSAASPVAAMPSIDPEAQFLHLQGLVRQLAATTVGPRADSPDPDLAMPVDAARTAGPQKMGHEVFSPVAAQPSPLAQRLAEAVAAERLDVLLEPIQLLAEARARHFEISVRFRAADGEIIPADEADRMARLTGLAASIDALKLPRVAKVVQRVQSRGGTPADVIAGLTGPSLADHQFMTSLATTFPDGMPSTIVLSFPQADVRAFARVHWSALNALGDMGVRFALNDVTDLDMDFDLLRARSFVFAKLDAEIFLHGLPCGGVTVSPSDICNHLEHAGLALIVGRLDSEDQLGRVANYRVPFGQGRLFGGARPVKSDILR